MHTMRSLGWVILASLLAAFPGGLALHAPAAAPVWYVVLVAIMSAAGVGVFAMLLGGSILLASRRVKLAAGVAFGVGLICSALVMSTANASDIDNWRRDNEIREQQARMDRELREQERRQQELEARQRQLEQRQQQMRQEYPRRRACEPLCL